MVRRPFADDASHLSQTVFFSRSPKSYPGVSPPLFSFLSLRFVQMGCVWHVRWTEGCCHLAGGGRGVAEAQVLFRAPIPRPRAPCVRSPSPAWGCRPTGTPWSPSPPRSAPTPCGPALPPASLHGGGIPLNNVSRYFSCSEHRSPPRGYLDRVDFILFTCFCLPSRFPLKRGGGGGETLFGRQSRTPKSRGERVCDFADGAFFGLFFFWVE